MTRLSRIEMPAFASRPALNAAPRFGLAPASQGDVFAPQFGRRKKSKVHRFANFTGRVLASFSLAIVSLIGVTQQNYIREGKVPTPREFLVDNFLRTNDGLDIKFMKPGPGYNTTDKLPPSKDDYVETAPTQDYEDAERILTNRILELVSGRPDLREALENLPRGLEIRIYNTPSIYNMSWEEDDRPEKYKRDCPPELDKDELSEAELIATCEYKAPERSTGHVHHDEALQTVTLGITIDYLDRMFNDTDDGYEITAHEVAGHMLDALNIRAGKAYVVGTDGILPGLTDEQQKLYIDARKEMKDNIKDKDKDSILRSYALKNDGEFLAVVVESFFERPDDLKEENEDMHKVLSEFFNVDPDNLHSANGPGLFTKAASNSPPAIISAVIIGGSFFLVFSGYAIWVRLPNRQQIRDAAEKCKPHRNKAG